MRDLIAILRPVSFIFLVYLLSPVFTGAQNKSNTVFQLNVLSNSSITINGRSNVNRFSCVACSPSKFEPIQGTQGRGKSISLKGSITVPVKNFDCKNRMLNSDLNKTLKAEQYPTMTIRFIDVERMPNTDTDRLNGTVQIELAGKRRLFTIPYTINSSGKTIRLEGNRSFTFSDFDLSPPKKIAGMVKVKDEFNVNFTLFLASAD